MSVRKKGARWEVRIRVGSGQRIERRLPVGATRLDAQTLEVALRRRLIESATGRIKYSLVEAFDHWQQVSQHLKSWKKDLRYRAGVVRGHIDRHDLSEVSDVADKIIAQGRKANLSPAGINRYLAILKRIANLAFERGWTDAPLAKRIKLLSGERRRTAYATPDQARALIDNADPRLQEMITFSLLTGLRRGELLGLTPEHIRGNQIVLEAGETKSDQPRLVPLPPAALKIAKRSIPWELKASNLRKLFEQARKAAGMPKLRWHDLRRTYGTWLVQSGTSVVDVRDLLGHSDVKTTNTYLASARQDLASAVKRLPSLGGKGGGRSKGRKPIRNAA